MITERFLLGSQAAQANVDVTLTGGAILGVLQNPSAHGWPDATNSGWRASMGSLSAIGQLRVLDTSLRVDGVSVKNRPTSGSVVHGPVTLFPDRTVVTLADIAIRVQQSSGLPLFVEKSRVTASAGVSSSICAIDNRDTRNGALTVVTDTTVVGRQINQVVAGNFITLDRCDISGGEDNVNIQSGVHVRNSYLHDLAQIEGGHHDSFQSGGAQDASVVHCTILAATKTGGWLQFSDGLWDPQNAVLMIGNYAGAINGVLFENNLVDGGNYTFNANWSTSNPHTGFVVRNNRFGRHFQYAPRAGDLGADIWEGNVWDDTGALIP